VPGPAARQADEDLRGRPRRQALLDRQQRRLLHIAALTLSQLFQLLLDFGPEGRRAIAITMAPNAQRSLGLRVVERPAELP
jgi:hypothetical protein